MVAPPKPIGPFPQLHSNLSLSLTRTLHQACLSKSYSNMAERFHRSKDGTQSNSNKQG